MKYIFGENTVAMIEPHEQSGGSVVYYADVRSHIAHPKTATIPKHWEACPAGGIMAGAGSGYWCDEDGNPVE